MPREVSINARGSLRLALVGQNISHSKSRCLYKELIGPFVEYDYLDFSEESHIPPIEELFLKYDGINITSPYKKYFLNDVYVDEIAKQVGAINCIGKFNDVLIGTNTDYLGVKDILLDFNARHAFTSVIILGDGVMSKITETVLCEMKKDYTIVSRRLLNQEIEYLDLSAMLNNSSDKLLVVNTCSREFHFKGKLCDNSIFWDFNYGLSEHSRRLSRICNYVDGRGLLEIQARYAVKFWNI